MGVYCSHTFYSKNGTQYLMEIHDVTYTASSVAFEASKEGYEMTFDDGDNELFFRQLLGTSVRVPVIIQQANTQMEALIEDIKNAQEDTYYLKIYKAGTLIWIGKLVPDPIEAEDQYPYQADLYFTSGLNRLEDFPADWAASISGSHVTLLEAIRKCLLPCEFDRFYSVPQPFISEAFAWAEEDQSVATGFLKNTRVPLLSFIDDPGKGTYKSCKQALVDLLKTYGATIRFDKGRWIITQVEVFLNNNINLINYNKTGGYLGSELSYTPVLVADTPNIPLSTLINSYKPSYKEVAIKCIDNSDTKITKATLNTDNLERSLSITNLTQAYTLKYNIQYRYFSRGSLGRAGMDVTFLTTLRIWCGFYRLWFVNGEAVWVLGLDGTVDAKGLPASPVRVDDTVHLYGPEIKKISGSINIPPLPVGGGEAIGNSLYLTVWVYADGKNREWSGDVTIVQEGEKEVQFSTSNTNTNAASQTIEEESEYSDLANDFTASPLQIYTGSEWKYSSAWTDTVLSGQGVLELLSKKAMFFQRSPRNLIQGSFALEGFNTLTKLVWRSSSYLFLNGTFTAGNDTWTGYWMELLSQTSDVVTVSNNPYRNQFSQFKGDLTALAAAVTDLSDKLNGTTQMSAKSAIQIKQLTGRSQLGAELDLLQNVPGILNGSADDTSYRLIATVSADGSKNVTLSWTPE